MEISAEWMREFGAYQNWYRALERRSRTGKVSDIMRSNYDSTLKQFLTFVNSKVDLYQIITPDDLIAQAEKSAPEEVVDLLNAFERWLQGEEIEGYHRRVLKRNERYSQPNTAGQKAHGIIRGFYTHNRIWLPKGRKNGDYVPRTKRNDVNHAVFKVEGDRVVQDYEKFRFFLSHLKFRDQTIALCLLSTSQDIGDLLKLPISFVKSQEGRERLYWAGTREKTGVMFRTFFSREATRFLSQYVEQVRAGAKPTKPIFLRTNGRPLKPRHVAWTFSEAAKRMGVVAGKAQNPYRPKRLRSIFSTACYQAKIDDGARHIFMGHSGSISEKYREMPVANLEVIYAQVEPFITVYAEVKSQELAQSIAKSEKALDLALDLREEVKNLTSLLEQREEELKNIKDRFDLHDRVAQMLVQRILDLEEQLAERDIVMRHDNRVLRRVAEGKIELIAEEEA